MTCFTKIQQCNCENYEFEKYTKKSIIRQSRTNFISPISSVYVIKARTSGCLRFDSETPSTGWSGLQAQLHRLCIPVPRSGAFHCPVAPTRVFSLFQYTTALRKINYGTLRIGLYNLTSTLYYKNRYEEEQCSSLPDISRTFVCIYINMLLVL